MAPTPLFSPPPQVGMSESVCLRLRHPLILPTVLPRMATEVQKKHVCGEPGCGKSFTRSDHLQRHALNHSQGNSTCPRCSVHFKRQDLLERHLERHRRKDEEAGGVGLGVVGTRKRLWRDIDGSIVEDRPEQSRILPEPATTREVRVQPAIPLSPSRSLSSTEYHSRDNSYLTIDADDLFLSHDISSLDPEHIDFFGDSSWEAPHPTTVSLDDHIFAPDTASSFNMPFTTFNNYSWLFDVDKDQEPEGFSNQEGYSTSLQNTSSYITAPLSQTVFSSTSNPGMLMPSPRSSASLYRGNIDQPQLPSLHLPASTVALSTPESSLPAKTVHIRPIIDDTVHKRILDLISQANVKAPNGSSSVQTTDPLLSISAMQKYCDLFFRFFNVSYPLIHTPTFEPSQSQPLLVQSIILLGTTYADKHAHRLAVCIHDTMRIQLFQHAAFSALPQLWMLQAILLTECFGKSRAGQKQYDMSHLFHGMLINLIRRSDCQSATLPSPENESIDPEQKWRIAMDVEQRKRLAFLCFLWDTQHAVLFSQSLCMSSFELRTTLPCDPEIWESGSASEWASRRKGSENITFLSVLKSFVSSEKGNMGHNLNAFSKLLILHGLMSIFWDMKRRDQTSLGSASLTLDWKPRISQAYEAWRADFEAYCMTTTMNMSNNVNVKDDFVKFSTNTMAIYHAAQICLNVEILDLQICAGAQHIIGRAVTSTDFTRSCTAIKNWVNNEPSMARKAAWHAAHMLRDGVMNLKNWDVDDVFHYPWCLYLATLTCWTFHSVLRNQNERPHRAEYDSKLAMNTLISRMTTQRPDDLESLAGSSSTKGLTSTMAEHLGQVRWAIIFEGTKVLKSLDTR
ncbi:hypothetical protein K461DRAFT_325084 [Myriangium duriaei CBS 260.36]|uniref:C2H2-type domain-containing protein n=1 Tax=Myriangium duriaei CBS 260.36 TaxID=1168546 RepID=A0A9P4MCT2_9PEZI|nr:hypothetical protein K461DRAFT_325084 [Myriangium duriaei CBS 260.36]